MKIFRLKHTFDAPAIFATPNHDDFVGEYLTYGKSLSAATRLPSFQLGVFDAKTDGFYHLSNSVLAFDKQTLLGPMGSALNFAGDLHETKLNDTDETIFILDVSAVYNCIDRANTIYIKFRGEERGVDHEMGIKVPAFFPNLIGDSTIFKIPQQMYSSIYVASRGREDSDDFYYMYQQSGLKGLEFQQVWDGD